MSIQKQITYTFIIFAAVISIIVGSIYGILYSRNYRNIIYAQLEERASVSVQQMSDIIWQMSLANQVLLSNQDVLNSIRRLSKYDMSEGSYENLYFSTAFSTIRSELNSYFNYENYYRIVFFNRTGVVISPSNTLADAMDLNINYEDLPWLDLVQEGNSVLIPCHLDDWGRNKAVVLSLVSGLVGNNMGYIEVQWLKEDLDQYLEPSNEESNVLFYNLDGELIYSYKDSPEGVDYFSYIQSAGFKNLAMTVYDNGSTSGIHPFWDGTRFVSHLDSENKIIAVVTLPANVQESMGNLIPVLLLIVLAFFVLSMCYVIVSSRRIAKPITSLSRIMEETNLDNLTELEFPEEESIPKGEEMEMLYLSYFHALERLSDSIEKEKKLSILQLEAQFGALQAQVNPHFLYNILNVVSAKGIMANDESICDICAALSRMLRYSTNTNTNQATVGEEEENLRNYLQLMKYRYEDRLEYEISIPEEVKTIVVPKVTLEQIVENCFQYEFADKMKTICISVTGSLDKNGWTISIFDNGVGFSDETINEIYEKMDEVRRKLNEERQFISMEIGGMGLINVYARLYLTFGDALIFTIDFVDEGASITIGAEYRREDKSDV